MELRNIIVIGASAGGFEAIKDLITALPADLNASIFVVWHISPEVIGVLPEVLNKENNMPASNAVDGEEIFMNRIYVAAPDQHLIIDKNRIRNTRGPKENRFRPAIDPTFRSAAYTFGPRVIGIILSGALDDGTAGLYTIKQSGGITIVQDPREADFPSMPENAIRGVKVDHIAKIAEIAELVIKFSQELVDTNKSLKMDESEKTRLEISVAMQDEALKKGVLTFGTPSQFACPDCHGVLSIITEGSRIRFRCHTGHAYSIDSLLSTITENIEDSLWSTIRGVEESVMLLNSLGDHYSEKNKPNVAASFFTKANEAQDRANKVRQAVIDHEQLSIRIVTEDGDNSAEAKTG